MPDPRDMADWLTYSGGLSPTGLSDEQKIDMLLSATGKRMLPYEYTPGPADYPGARLRRDGGSGAGN